MQPLSLFEHPPPGALTAYGWSPSVAARYQPHDHTDHHPVRIVRVDGASCIVATAAGVSECRAGPLELAPVTGDWGVARNEPRAGLVLAALLPRSTSLVRTNATSTGEQCLAANVDTVLAVHGLDRPHRVGRLQRLAILSWDAGVRPVIVLTKLDLAGTEEASIDVDDAIGRIHDVIHDIEVMAVSSMTGDGIPRLREKYIVAGHTIALVGESGAGKSSLANRLAGSDTQSTGATRRGDHKGRHTTTSRDLIPLPTGAVLIDTPGLRSISMPVATDGLTRAYADLDAYTAACRFRDCSHSVEPGCAIGEAIDDGRLSEERWQGYLKLEREMAFEARRVAVRKRKAETRSARRRRRAEPRVDEW